MPNNQPAQNTAGLIYNDAGSKSFQYDGTNDYISSQFGALANLGASISLTAWTMCAWVKPTRVGGFHQTVIGSHDTAVSVGTETIYFKITNNSGGNLGVSITVKLDDSTTVTAKGNTNQPEPEANVRYHIAATFDTTADELILYINGGRIAGAAVGATRTMKSGWDHVLIGAGKFDASIADFTQGYISDVSIHNSVLTAGDIAALAASAVD